MAVAYMRKVANRSLCFFLGSLSYFPVEMCCVNDLGLILSRCELKNFPCRRRMWWPSKVCVSSECIFKFQKSECRVINSLYLIPCS